MRLPVVDEGAQAQMEIVEQAAEEALSESSAPETQSAATKIEKARLQGYTGSMCGGCGSIRMKRNGSCELCLDCGATSGCS